MATSPERVGSPLTHYTSLLEEIVGCGDMVLLDTVSIETVVDNLRQRYSSDGIYVSLLYGAFGVCLQCLPPTDLHRQSRGVSQPVQEDDHLHGRKHF